MNDVAVVFVGEHAYLDESSGGVGADHHRSRVGRAPSAPQQRCVPRGHVIVGDVVPPSARRNLHTTTLVVAASSGNSAGGVALAVRRKQHRAWNSRCAISNASGWTRRSARSAGCSWPRPSNPRPGCWPRPVASPGWRSTTTTCAAWPPTTSACSEPRVRESAHPADRARRRRRPPHRRGSAVPCRPQPRMRRRPTTTGHRRARCRRWG